MICILYPQWYESYDDGTLFLINNATIYPIIMDKSRSLKNDLFAILGPLEFLHLNRGSLLCARFKHGF